MIKYMYNIITDVIKIKCILKAKKTKKATKESTGLDNLQSKIRFIGDKLENKNLMI